MAWVKSKKLETSKRKWHLWDEAECVEEFEEFEVFEYNEGFGWTQTWEWEYFHFKYSDLSEQFGHCCTILSHIIGSYQE